VPPIHLSKAAIAGTLAMIAPPISCGSVTLYSPCGRETEPRQPNALEHSFTCSRPNNKASDLQNWWRSI
jgi:hypothetical protein